MATKSNKPRTKSYKLRLDLRDGERLVDSERFTSRADETRSVQQWLDETREAFNTGVDYLTAWLLRMHRGAGLYRERDGIWPKWQEISTRDKLIEARARHKADPDSFALLENRALFDAFKSKGRSETEAVELAECCRRIAKELCPPSEDNLGAQMPRDSLDLLLNPRSDARGLRFGSNRLRWVMIRLAAQNETFDQFQDALAAEVWTHASGNDAVLAVVRKSCVSILKNVGVHRKHLNQWWRPTNDGASGRAARRTTAVPKPVDWDSVRTKLTGDAKTPDWLRNEVLVNAAQSATSHELLMKALASTPEFSGEGGTKQITRLTKEAERNPNVPWDKWRARIVDNATREVRDYAALYRAGCLPIPGFGCYHDHSNVTIGPVALTNVGSEWKRAMWNMAGQRVRSHLGWVRRRANERMLWELRTALFERGGWIRTKRNGRAISKGDLTPEDIRFGAPPSNEAGDFEQRPAYAGRQWVKTLRQYETDEMPKHLEDVAFGAAEQARIRKQTAKGWPRVRDKWIGLIDRAQNSKPLPSADDLLEAFDQMRNRKTRDFGDRRLFEWLAAPERRWLWDRSDRGADNDCGHEDRDCVTAFISHNEHLADKPDSITFTRSGPVKHPAWPFFGENSAVKYWLTREPTPDGKARLVLVLKQLLSHQHDGSYTAVDRVKIALRGYDDFEKSFAVPDDAADVSAKQALVFRDDLLGGNTRQGTLSGMKLTWERHELEAANRKQKPRKKRPRIYAIFSCDAGQAGLPDWLTQHVGRDVKLKKPRDGMTRAFFLKKTISRNGATEDGATLLPPGQRNWPREAIDNGFTIRGTDLGYRTSSAGAWWRLSSTKPDGRTAWQVGTCEGNPVYAVLERAANVSLPGDGERLPPDEQVLRERLFSLRTRLNLNNALLRIARLLALNEVTQRIRAGDKTRTRTDGTKKRIGVRWTMKSKTLSPDEIKDNCRKAGEQLSRWASTDAMSQSLRAVGHDGSLWGWLATREEGLKRLGDLLPTTSVPSEQDAKEQGLDREALKAAREKEDDAFASCVHELRTPLAKALCHGHNAEKHIRAKSGLWSEFDAALVRELSYSDRGSSSGRRTLFETGLFRLLRKPPVTKHRDRKDDANNLPHGRTHRGGLSMARLNFLDDVKNFVRRWSCRPRWPGDVRRVPEGAKFDRCDTEHLDHLREHRAKLIAHADVAQALGFEQDLRRGLWRYRDSSAELLWHRPERGHWYRQNGDALAQCQPTRAVNESAARHPHPAFDPAHVLVYEDLTRYKMSSDRPKNENAGLARWSHRRILAFAQHIGGLFGVPVATVDARFSSRFCSRCGAPGRRAARFDPSWLDQAWMQRILQSNDNGDAAMRSVARDVRAKIEQHSGAFRREQDRPWVLRDGGTHFVCANAGCSVHSQPINADENAAANIGLRFLRGVDGIRVTISANGRVTKSVGYVAPGMVLTQAGDAQGEQYWSDAAATGSSTGPTRRRRGTRDESAPDTDNDDEDESGGVRSLFRDPSGGFRCPDRWFEAKVYWAAVAQSCAAGTKGVNASRFGSDELD